MLLPMRTIRTLFSASLITILSLWVGGCPSCGVEMECGGVLQEPGQTSPIHGTSVPDVASFERVVIFGDSLSDTGALLAQSFGIAPNPNAYPNGRFSNGIVWVDHFTDALQIPSVSHAYGGAKTTGDPGAIPKPFDAAIDEYLSCRNGSVSSTELFVLWIGHNDYYQGAKDPSAIASNTLRGMRKLFDAGARSFMVPEVMPLTGTPSPFSEDGAENDDDFVDGLTDGHNASLRQGLDALAMELNVAIARPVPARMRERILADPALLGLVNTEDACYTGETTWPNGGEAEICEAPETYFYWDGVHPSSKVHCAYAVEMLRSLSEMNLIDVVIDEDARLSDCGTHKT